MTHPADRDWTGGGKGENELLASCHCSGLKVATEHGLTTVLSLPSGADTCHFPLGCTVPIVVSVILKAHPYNSGVAFIGSGSDTTTAIRAPLDAASQRFRVGRSGAAQGRSSWGRFLAYSTVSGESC